MATAARGHSVGIVDGEACCLDGIEVVDLRALQIGSAERVDHDLHAVELELDVTLDGAASSLST